MIANPRRTGLAILAACLLAGCEAGNQDGSGEGANAETSRGVAAAGPAASREDPHSYANPEAVRVTHVALDLDVDFEAKRLSGFATLALERVDAAADTLVLDSRDLKIRGITDTGSGRSLEFTLGEIDEHLGRPVRVTLAPETREIRVEYVTGKGATALQWLAPRQTAGGGHPFLFTQSQAIHARSWIPLQDSPGVRVTYEAKVRVPAGLRAVMSAANDPGAELDGGFSFEMPQAVPPYLMALGVGDLAFRSMGADTGVYAEPSLVEAAAAEFEDTQSMLETTESLYGPYQWGRYDLLILPPSFPFGGMENPRLSFITPTVIAGDKSLVGLIAHELAHSWSGNLVTNATWRDLWLNEGFTTYVENRIMEAVFGKRRARMEAALAHQALLEEMEDLEPAEEVLAIDLTGEHPDEVFTDIPYTKGMLFLMWLEDRFGRERFDEFLRGYFDHFAFRSITTAQFTDYLQANLVTGDDPPVTMEQVHEWIHEPGIPAYAIIPESDAFARVDALREDWLGGNTELSELPAGEWTVHEWLHFLDSLPREMTTERMAALDKAFGLTDTGNNMVLRSWLKLAVRNEYRPAYDRLETYLTGIGRVYLIKPVYETLMESGQTGLARRIYDAAEPGYHPLARTEIETVLKPDEGAEDGE